jgi:hypothetical protein
LPRRSPGNLVRLLATLAAHLLVEHLKIQHPLQNQRLLARRTEGAASDAGVGRLHEATGRLVLTAAAGQFAYEGLIGATGQRHEVSTWAMLETCATPPRPPPTTAEVRP